jgi:tetratricopeptide (TPR) repeat protein
VELALKRLRPESLEAALEKAAHYRDLNQPEEAESICRDVLEIHPDRPGAWKILGLALTDRFPSGQAGLLEEALDAFGRLRDDYERTYHVGVAWERAAKAHLERDEAHSAVAGFEHALQAYETAERMRPDSPDPVLRWNRCIRLLRNHPALRAAMRVSREAAGHLGD